jgi:hypothetical protein
MEPSLRRSAWRTGLAVGPSPREAVFSGAVSRASVGGGVASHQDVLTQAGETGTHPFRPISANGLVGAIR